MPQKLKDLTGESYGRLVVLRLEELISNPGGSTDRTWRCRCACGGETVVRSASLKSGGTTSCGCTRYEKQRALLTKHGNYWHPLYQTWAGMLRRCLDQDLPAWPNYGGRGIKVCDRWLGEQGFLRFVADMGDRPNRRYSLDRRDNHGDYTPDNCRWATTQQQGRNRRTNITVTISGETLCLKGWCERLGIPYGRVHQRVHKLGWEPRRALEVTK